MNADNFGHPVECVISTQRIEANALLGPGPYIVRSVRTYRIGAHRICKKNVSAQKSLK